ncbi:MAG: cell wall hydrolase [Firmicutes bacterium]|nr:cell wall hydrolase [Bacillota bacterium]
MSDFVDKEIEFLARTIYGEARGENLETQLYVAWVIRNRVQAKGRFGATYEEVVTKPFQFSSWNQDDPNFERVLQPTGAAWRTALGIAQAVYYAPEKFNPIPGIYHFYDRTLDAARPSWAEGAEIVRFEFIPKMRFVRGVK